MEEKNRAFSWRSALNGVVLLVRSPYLLLICAYLFLFTLSSTTVYFMQGKIVSEEITDPQERRQLFANMNLMVNCLALVIQVFFTGRIIMTLGIGFALCLLPFLVFIGFLSLSAWPILGVLVVFQVIRRGANYAIAKPAKELLFTVVGREEKYKSKSFIDTFVYRGGDATGAWSFGLIVANTAVHWVALLAAPLALLWGSVGFLLGRKQHRMTGETRELPEPGKETP